ncbi:DUF4126 domain-containing protein [Spirosoma spitsbergense]|jgi:hypothetical protein|uniref:DUF4126 domain-containing protein n=1 Tax=Spirosoma spitsbergense TaxID=431554 RepID=UPI0003A46006|nr:DUF4126 domain-containing protein [Spirosoma spitsbergense]
MSLDWIMSACIGVGLAACCGFRIFVPLLIASAATKFGFIGTMAGFEWLGTWPALFGLLVATMLEVGAYYVPWLDNVLDTIATPTSIIAGTILSTSFLHIDNPVLHWGLGLILGGSSAGIVQAGTSLLRLGSSATTGGLANPVVASGENIASIVLSICSILLPLVTAIVIGLILLFIMSQLAAKRKIWFSRTPKQAGNPLSQIPRSNNGRP